MAKTVSVSYGEGPWNMKKNAIKDFIQVTEDNRKNAIVVGRILYVIDLNGSVYQFRGTFSIDPCFTKGWFRYPLKPWQNNFPGHIKVFMPEDIDYNAWASQNKFLIDDYIFKKTLYIKPTDPILKFFKD